MTATEAQAWGLVNRVVSLANLSSSALEYAEALVIKNPEGIAAMKRLTQRGAELSLDDGLVLEQNLTVPTLLSENVAEGLRAFREKREPVFR